MFQYLPRLRVGKLIIIYILFQFLMVQQQFVHGGHVIGDLVVNGIPQFVDGVIGRTCRRTDQVFIILLSLGIKAQPFFIGAGALQILQSVQEKFIGRDEVIGQNLEILGFIRGLLFLRKIRHGIDAFVKGGREKILLRRQKIGGTVVGDGIHTVIGHKETGPGFLLLEYKKLFIIIVNGGEQSQIVIHVLFVVKNIFCQKYGKLGLNSYGGSQGLIVKLQAFKIFLCFVAGFQDLPGQLLFFSQQFYGNGLKAGFLFFLGFGGFFQKIHGEFPEGAGTVGQAV